jgi:hypothetical protein
LKHAWAFETKAPGSRKHYRAALNNPDVAVIIGLGLFCGPYQADTIRNVGVFALTAKAIEALQRAKLAA